MQKWKGDKSHSPTNLDLMSIAVTTLGPGKVGGGALKLQDMNLADRTKKAGVGVDNDSLAIMQIAAS